MSNLFKGISGWLKKQKALNDRAAKEMDARYPGGWSQSPTNMNELMNIKKRLK